MTRTPGDMDTVPLLHTESDTQERDIPPITQVGRYVLLKRLGQGGMGVVFAAYDPDLDRKVALKLLRPDKQTDSEQARARLLREAQAMARVSHPNVIPIFDVGIWGAQVFLAMEIIEGGTLSDWLKAAPRHWREVLERLIDAGRGLQAAHEKGLVHRDFKPGNVLVSQGGRVYVTDFGLARQVGMPHPEPATAEEPRPVDAEHRMLEVTLTETGLVMGTPHYMSPEQVRGQDVDARSDQFSFCVSLYLGLYGQRPFDPASMRAAVLSTERDVGAGSQPTKVEGMARKTPPRAPVIHEPPRDAKVPAWIRQAVMRGLSVNPDERFASMKELLEALSQDTRRTQRRRWAAVATASAVGLSLVGGRVYQRSQVCAGVGELMTEVWSPAARQKVEASFLGTGKPFAGHMASGVLGVLDGYAQAWTQQRTEACEATRVRGVQTEELLTQREVCLERRRRDMRALVDQLYTADGPLVERALDAAHALPALHECAELESLTERQRLPADPRKRSEIQALEDRVAELKALVDTGRYTVAQQKVGPLSEAVERSGYLPLMAGLHTHRGWLNQHLGKLDEASRDLARALYEAEAGRADRQKVDISTRLLFVEDEQKHFDAAERWASLAEATLQRIGGDPLLEGVLLVHRGNMAVSQKRFAEARALFEKAQRLQERVLPPGHPKRARVTYLLGSLLARMGERTRAVELLRQALEQTQAAVGKLHPDTARRHEALAWVLREEGNPAAALEHARAVVDIRKPLLGPDHRQTTGAMAEVGQCLLDLERYPEALRVYEETLALQLRVLKPEDTYLQYTYDGVGQALLGLGRALDAIAPLRKAVSFESMPPDVLAISGFALAKALSEEGQHEAARAEAEKARERFTRAGKEQRAAEILAWLEAQAKPGGGHSRRP
ncbi:serine/threonine-protein kinase [Hyalangium rubrum]|uniref:Serine/threonine-protein kinase n=1 Tax=Hyalangium rubrum TaxID=3103134 RepID=A0ABU5H1R4_9BACT|nr:serine/threonine-protein kinase [Hyalangium sp. s54d21]MDY7227374.1 serine/threonine-protein kinase [Hyalangium sp. s54d21]